MDYKKPSVSNILDIIYDEVYDTPDFVLQAAINKGNCIHKRAEKFIKYGVVDDCVCHKWVKSHNLLFMALLDDLRPYKKMELLSETTLEQKDLIGIADLIIHNGKQVIIVDFKTNSQPKTDKWEDQLLMYNYLFTGDWELTDDVKLQIWHYNQKNLDKTVWLFNKNDNTNKKIEVIKDAIKLFWEKQEELENGEWS